MATVTLRLDDKTRHELELLAQGRNTNVSALLRAAIDELLGRTPVAASTSEPKSLSMLDRQVLALQHEILKRLSTDDDDIEHHDKLIEVLSRGLTSEYYKVFSGLSSELTPAEGVLTMEILDMFSVLETALDRCGDEALTQLGDDADHLLKFAGFDHNDDEERRLADIAKFLIEDGRWSTLAYHFDHEHEGGNSHQPVLERYRRMLRTYQVVVAERKARAGQSALDSHRFEIADLQKILDAAHIRRTRR